MFRPEEDDARHFLPELLPVGAGEVERVDVLVSFRRVLGVLNRAVGAFVEPFRVLDHVRVIGRTIDREIERERHPAPADLLFQPGEIFERA